MAFDREKFFQSWKLDGHYTRGSIIADGFEALEAELAELKAACLGLKDRMGALERMSECCPDTPEAPPRETGWAVVNYLGDPFTCDVGFEPRKSASKNRARVLWFGSKEDAAVLQRAVAIAEPAKDTDVALLYKDTLEEVDA